MLHITDDEFRLLSGYIKQHSGIHLKDEKKTLLVGRLSQILNEQGFTSFMSYYEHLKQDTHGSELSRLIDRVTTNHTYFMREPEHFNFFQKEVLPYLEKSVAHRDLRVWCAASSSGEEPYTLAMIMDEYFGSQAGLWDKKLLATDLSVSVLDTAKKGIYYREKVNTLPKVWTNKYFDKVSETSVVVNQKMKDQVIFRRFNLLESRFPFKKKFHVIFLRNVMIYFDNPTKDTLIRKMYDALEYGGYLFIGHSESINREKSAFKYVQPAVYRKI